MQPPGNPDYRHPDVAPGRYGPPPPGAPAPGSASGHPPGPPPGRAAFPPPGPPAPPPARPRGPQDYRAAPPAPWGVRLFGLIVDVMAFWAIVWVVYFIGMLVSTLISVATDAGFREGTSDGVPPAFMIGTFTTIALALFCGFAYFWLLTSFTGRTAGKLLTNTITVSTATGFPPSKGRAAARAAVQILLGLTLIGALIDFLLGASSSQIRTLHDRAGGTIVVQRRL
ncbi:RDD family protein [Allonocardiopsis opalescens]|uniref:RDD family protein n=1 Tax=Allonocardiopsis opalescens TaxID=1144618 RepID=A0A2T0Q777_9ACTN|nr:RDD family protein [Allonocardiopsis opalescens]PRX99687.1 RDD family protein [Allonocardiopsis opalescens]